MIKAPVPAAGAARPTFSRTLGDLARVTAVSVAINGALLALLLQRLG